MYNPFSLEGKTILVTGASSGIGRSIAVECSKMGAAIIATARNDRRLQETIDLLAGDNHTKVIADLSDYDQLCIMVNQLPKLDGVVCNAGVVKALITQISEKEDVSEIFNINTFASIHLIQSLLQSKKLNKGASIVFMSSISGVYCGAIGGSLYGATKAALQGFSKALALELASRKIRVNTVNPGMIDTGIFDNTSISEEQLAEDAQRYPLKRYGKPEEVAHAAVYLLSDATKWVTGSSLLIDGGFTLQ
jgi:NAD(P)-dependent dehydrogenase (short-subunit alcohol dehydrogenase family)